MSWWSSELTGYSERLKQEAILGMLRWEFGAQSKSAWICRSWISAFYWCPEGQSEGSEVTAIQSAITPHPFLVFFSTFLCEPNQNSWSLCLINTSKSKFYFSERPKPFFLIFAWQASCKNEENQCQVCLNIQGRVGVAHINVLFRRLKRKKRKKKYIWRSKASYSRAIL